MVIFDFFRALMKRTILATTILALSVISVPSLAIADAGSFLKSLEGEWRGRGLYRFEGRNTDERLNCRVTNTYNEAAERLSLKGDCATAQFKNSIQGQLAKDGNNVSGAMMGTLDGSRMTKSMGSIKGNQLVVQAYFVDNATGTLYRSQQIIRKTGKGFEADFYWYDNKLGKFTKSGNVKFTSK
ncbi:MAG: hypothetical protein ACR2O0_00210 [Rhizobiaceae bacterium]